jgi:hypothetical protein
MMACGSLRLRFGREEGNTFVPVTSDCCRNTSTLEIRKTILRIRIGSQLQWPSLAATLRYSAQSNE